MNGIPLGRIVGALMAVVALQVLFALSYVGAFHDPTPHDLRIAVVATSPSATEKAVASLNTAGGTSIDARPADTTAQARNEVLAGRAQAAFFLGGKSDELLVASAASPSQSALLATQFRRLAAQQKRTLRILDVAPLPRADSRGVTPFYVTLVMVFGGYLGVVVLGLVTSPTAKHGRAVAMRLAALALYSLLSATAVVLSARLAFGVLAGHEAAVIAAAALICFATCAVSVSLQALLGVAGTGLVILLFVILGNPASGGAVPYRLLPEPYRTFGPYLVNGSGVDLVRNLTYFHGRGDTRPLVVLLTWAAVGSLVSLTISTRRYRRLSAAELELMPAVAAGL